MIYEIGKNVATYYIERVLGIQDFLNSGERFSEFKRKEILTNFKENYKKNKGPSNSEIIQAENQINLALDTYNRIKSKENCN